MKNIFSLIAFLAVPAFLMGQSVTLDSEWDTAAEINAATTDDDFTTLTGNEVITGSWDFGGAGSIEIPNSAAPTVNAAGEIALDTTITDHQPLLKYYSGTEEMVVIALPSANLGSTDNYIIKYDATSDDFQFEADSGSSVDIDALTAATEADVVNSDLIMVSDGGTEKKMTFENLIDHLEGESWTFSTLDVTTLTADNFDGNGAVDIDYGSADITDHTFTTDGTGDAEIVLPNDSIGDAEVNITYSESFTLAEPDQLQPISDVWVLKKFIAEKYPSGVTMTSIHVSASASSSDTYNFEESASPTGSTPSTVEAITLTTATEAEDDGTFSDASIAADGYLLVDLDATPDDIAYVTFTISYTID